MTPVRLKTPLPEGKQALLTIMDRIARLMGMRYFVVGATARDILMYHFHGFPLNRASPDCSGPMKPDTDLGENARHKEVSDEQAMSIVFY